MDRRQSRSAGRSRREERRSQSVRSSQESSLAGNLSPGRHHHGHRGREGGGGFFKNLFGRRDKSPMDQRPSQQPFPIEPNAPPPPPVSSSPAAKLKAMLSFAPHSHSRHTSPTPNRTAEPDDMQVKDMHHRMQLLQAQVQDYERIKAQLAAEQRSAQEWKEKWNYQNFKLNLMVDMLVLRVLELDQETAAATAR
ncbi:hypothetical protein Agub_g11676 [Astrephomene gubernaculifera]|uniref:Uncharacterized protein n=1 Tax=Astrephomene gubernaculifera TaxID=47775 RepID=A0AAD3E1D8_9CHLO|nr:hypothetical protein Agub_g11676 [Astrephomene gubernaculifera]